MQIYSEQQAAVNIVCGHELTGSATVYVSQIPHLQPLILMGRVGTIKNGLLRTIRLHRRDCGHEFS
jgi:hypothetical protein